jgi:hypothetical protein
MKPKLYTFYHAVFVAILIALFLFGCKKDDSNIPDSEPGKVVPQGQPAGSEYSKVIGANGGSILSPDGKIKIEIPAGALNSNKEITIQPITNTNPAGLAMAYRLTPHDIQFEKPVNLFFYYNPQEILKTSPDALGIAYQDNSGVWKALGGAQVNKELKFVKVSTTHFSDWSFFESIHIDPINSSVAVGDQVEFQLSRTLPYADLLEPLVPGKEYEIIDRVPLENKFIKQWTLTGEGNLQSAGNKATYTAPTEEPGVNPETVSVAISLPQKGQFLLLTTVLVIDQEEGIFFKIEDGPLIKTDEGLAQFFPTSGETQVSGTVRENDNYIGSVEINWRGSGTNPGAHAWDMLGGINFMYRVKGSPLNNMYYEHYNIGDTWNNSMGQVTIQEYGTVNNFVTGTFVLDKSGYFGDGFTTYKIEGYFRVKRVANN